MGERNVFEIAEKMNAFVRGLMWLSFLLHWLLQELSCLAASIINAQCFPSKYSSIEHGMIRLGKSQNGFLKVWNSYDVFFSHNKSTVVLVCLKK